MLRRLFNMLLKSQRFSLTLFGSELIEDGFTIVNSQYFPQVIELCYVLGGFRTSSNDTAVVSFPLASYDSEQAVVSQKRVSSHYVKAVVIVECV